MISINDMNPGPGYRVLVYDIEEGFDCAYYRGNNLKEWINKNNKILTNVTHWLYLPNAPDSPKETK